MNVNQYYINVANENTYQAHCSHASNDILDRALQQGLLPSRRVLVISLIAEVLYTPFYLIRKISEIVFHILNWNLLDQSTTSFGIKDILNDIELLGFLLSYPLLSTAIRLSAAIMGLLIPELALRGWILAEAGDAIFYRILSKHAPELSPRDQVQAHEEIQPSSAIFYLGSSLSLTLFAEMHNNNKNEIDNALPPLMYNILKDIYEANPHVFNVLFKYEYASKPNAQLSQRSDSYHLAYDTKVILHDLRQRRPKGAQETDEEYDFGLMEEITCSLSSKELGRIFTHLCLNLEPAFLEDDLNLNPRAFELRLSEAKDMFSQIHRYGRARFQVPSAGLVTYSRV